MLKWQRGYRCGGSVRLPTDRRQRLAYAGLLRTGQVTFGKCCRHPPVVVKCGAERRGHPLDPVRHPATLGSDRVRRGHGYFRPSRRDA